VSTGDGVTSDEAVEELREQTRRLQLLVRELEERVERLEGRAGDAASEVLRWKGVFLAD
jgi:predicted  nucleic acid-binding Zn-ribbon protein